MGSATIACGLLTPWAEVRIVSTSVPSRRARRIWLLLPSVQYIRISARETGEKRSRDNAERITAARLFVPFIDSSSVETRVEAERHSSAAGPAGGTEYPGTPPCRPGRLQRIVRPRPHLSASPRRGPQ